MERPRRWRKGIHLSRRTIFLRDIWSSSSVPLVLRELLYLQQKWFF